MIVCLLKVDLALSIWRMKRVRRNYRMLRDTVIMALVWVVWHERNSRIFNHKASSISDLIDAILYYVDFWAGHWSFPLKRKVDTSVLTYASKRVRFPSGFPSASSQNTGGSLLAITPRAHVDTVGVNSAVDGGAHSVFPLAMVDCSGD